MGPDGIQIRLVAPNTPFSSFATATTHSIKSPIRLQQRPPHQSGHSNGGGGNGGGGKSQPVTTATVIPSDRSVVTRISENEVREDVVDQEKDDGKEEMTEQGEQGEKTKLKRFVMRSTPTRRVHQRNVGQTGYDHGSHGSHGSSTTSSNTRHGNSNSTSSSSNR